MKPQFTIGDEVIYCPSLGPATLTTVKDIEKYTFNGENQTFPSYKYHLESGETALTFELVKHGTVWMDVREAYYTMQAWHPYVTISNVHFSLEYDTIDQRLFEVPHDENISPREYAVTAYDAVNMTKFEFDVQLKKEEGSR